MLPFRSVIRQQTLGAHDAEVAAVSVRSLDVAIPLPPGVLVSTAGSATPEDAITSAKIAREAWGIEQILVEVGYDGFPDVEGTLEAVRGLIAENFRVIAWTIDDVLACRRLAELGVEAILVEDGPRVPHLVGLPVLIAVAQNTYRSSS